MKAVAFEGFQRLPILHRITYMEDTTVREFRIAPMYRRCCWYLIVGFGLIVVVASLIGPMAPQRGPADIARTLVVVGLLWLAMFAALQWKLRLDEHGISRRLLFYWDHWNWSDFASGRIRKLVSHTLYDQERPLWRRRLGLGFLEDRDRQVVLGIINAYYVLPPPPAVPETLTLRYGFRRKVTFDEGGIHLTDKNVPREFQWNELRHVHMTRLDPLRRDFVSLQIALPDEVIELKYVTHQGGTSPTWRGATADEVNEFLFAHVPSDRIDVSTPEEQSLNREVIERELKEAIKQQRQMKFCLTIFGAPLVACFVWLALQRGVFQGAVMIGMMAIPTVPLYIYIVRAHRERVAKNTELLRKANHVTSISEVPSEELHDTGATPHVAY